jgi:lauroyl/myristoyl acyltransferase
MATSNDGRGAATATLAQRVRARLVATGAWLASLLPEGLVLRAADGAGILWYRLAPERAAQARRNFARVSEYLVERGLAGPRLAAAARDPRALESLVRAAFRNNARYYVELTRLPRWDARMYRERVLVETPDVVEEAFAGDRAVIFLGLHFGAVELPGLYLASRTGRPTTAPMETLGDPALQSWFARTRSRVGVRIVSLREARRELTAALRRGEAVGLIADRDVTGGGLQVPFFGAPAPMPIGPALLAIESGAPIYVAGMRREGIGRYRGRLARVEIPAEGSRRERVAAIVTGIAAAFEEAISHAPEQWWATFFPIWPDMEQGAADPEASTAGATDGAPMPDPDGDAS